VKTRPKERKHFSVVLVGSHFCPTLEGPTRALELINHPQLQAPPYRTLGARVASRSAQPTAWRPRVGRYGTCAYVSDSSFKF
jgi:hypothetical protein